MVEAVPHLHRHSKHIYFDGYLPPHKRNVRLDRLQRSSQKLSSHHAISQKLQPCKRSWDGKPLPPGVVFPSGSPTQAAFRGLPPATFVVPAVLDALGTSKYAAITTVVPGEAEVYCATAARDNGGIILSNDSDLFVHNLGNGAFVYLDSVELRTSETKDQTRNSRCCKIFRLEMFRPPYIAQRLGVKTLQELAFQFVRRHSHTLSEAVKATRDQQDREEKLVYEKFLQEYTTEPSVSENQQLSPQALARLHTQARFLDPRISELICQLESNDSDNAEVYLLFLIEDPTRSSAWSVSSDQRSFIYSVCALHLNNATNYPRTIITECRRRAQDFVMHPIHLLTHPETLTFATTFQTQLQIFPQAFPGLPSTLIWRTYALFKVHLWHLNASKPPPSRDLLQRALTGNYTPHPTWEDIHLSAQLQAVLYSLRMIQQILQYISSAMQKPLPRELQQLAASLQDLPVLARLMPSPFDLTEVVDAVDIEDVMEKLALLLQEEVGDEEGCVELVKETFTNQASAAPPPSSLAKKKKRKKAKTKKKDSEVVDKRGKNNMFQMLA